jgi:hypothetical protein
LIYHVYRTKRDRQFGWALKGIETTIKADEAGWSPTLDAQPPHPHRGHIVAALPIAEVSLAGDTGLFRLSLAEPDRPLLAYGTGQPAL